MSCVSKQIFVLSCVNVWQPPPPFFFNPPFAVPSDFVAVAMKIFVNETVELAKREYKFYNCAATVRKSENTPWVRILYYLFFLLLHESGLYHIVRHLFLITLPVSSLQKKKILNKSNQYYMEYCENDMTTKNICPAYKSLKAWKSPKDWDHFLRLLDPLSINDYQKLTFIRQAYYTVHQTGAFLFLTHPVKHTLTWRWVFFTSFNSRDLGVFFQRLSLVQAVTVMPTTIPEGSPMSQTLNPSVLLCHSLKIHSDTEHSIRRQPWCKRIAVHEQMRDQGSVCKLWCMVVWNAPLAFSLSFITKPRKLPPFPFH